MVYRFQWSPHNSTNANSERSSERSPDNTVGKRNLHPALKLKTARALLSQQPDFRSQKSWLEETLASDEGFFLDFYPKFHCEFNFIELYWGASKAYIRRQCDNTFVGLQRLLPLALNSVSVQSIRRFARKCFRFMDAY
jgi:hypothetical protein